MAITDVTAGADLQAALNNAQPGDTLRLETGATWEGDYLFTEKAAGGVTISCDVERLPLPGNRVTQTLADGYPRVVGHLRTNPKASGYTLAGIRVDSYPNYYTTGLVDIGGQGVNMDYVCTSEAELPRDWVIDRCWFQADPGWGGKRGIAANCGALTVRDSVIKNFFSDGQDTQAIGAWNGTGPYTITNNYLEASGENVMFGGACPAIHGLVPSDITITGNWFHKPDSWRVVDVMGRPAGLLRPHRTKPGLFVTKAAPAVKNLFEIKNGKRCKLFRNIFEGCWSKAQAGFAFQLTVRTCEAGDYPWACVNDILIEQNLIISENGINILGIDGAREHCPDPPYAGEAQTIVMVKNEIRASWCFQIMSAARGITITDNTCAANYGAMMAFDTMEGLPEMTDLIVERNAIRYGTGIVGSGAGPGTQALDMFWEAWKFAGNAVFGIPSSELWWITQPQWYPPDNLYTDAVDVPPGYGCDTSALERDLAHVRDGQTAGTTPQPTGGTITLSAATNAGKYELVPVG